MMRHAFIEVKQDLHGDGGEPRVASIRSISAQATSKQQIAL